MAHILFENFLTLLAVFTLVWIISVWLKDASIVDVLWGPACAFPAILTYIKLSAGGDEVSLRAMLLAGLVTIWGLRLGLYLGQRNLGHGEDFRYQKMRANAGSDGAFAISSYYKIYLLQFAVAFFVSLPTQVGQFGQSAIFKLGDNPLGPLAALGIIIFLVGILFEAVGDYQLAKFKKNPANKGRLMTQGLWAWTRHPNYFGDAAVWTGLTLIALESQFGFLTVLSPALMIFFLYAVSGKALLERSMAQKYGEYASYRERVSGFLPRPPRP